MRRINWNAAWTFECVANSRPFWFSLPSFVFFLPVFTLLGSTLVRLRNVLEIYWHVANVRTESSNHVGSNQTTGRRKKKRKCGERVDQRSSSRDTSLPVEQLYFWTLHFSHLSFTHRSLRFGNFDGQSIRLNRHWRLVGPATCRISIWPRRFFTSLFLRIEPHVGRHLVCGCQSLVIICKSAVHVFHLLIALNPFNSRFSIFFIFFFFPSLSFNSHFNYSTSHSLSLFLFTSRLWINSSSCHIHTFNLFFYIFSSVSSAFSFSFRSFELTIMTFSFTLCLIVSIHFFFAFT